MLGTILLNRIVLTLSVVVFTVPAIASDAANLFSARCARCHNDIKRMKSSADQARQILQENAIRRHQFKLDAKEIEAIVSYFKDNGK